MHILAAPKPETTTTVIAWKPFKPVPNAQEIADAIKDIPEYIVLTPLQDKQPKRLNWQTEPPVCRTLIYDLIVKGEKAISQQGTEYIRFWSGYGARTGDISNGLLAIDIDGASALPLLLAILEVEELPHTVSWKSGKPGRLQLVFQIPDQHREALKQFTRRLITEYNGHKTLHDETGKAIEALELRYNDVQSVLPPSRHPQTGLYQWINSFKDTAILEAPEKLCQFLLNLREEEKHHNEEKERLAKERLLKQQQQKEGYERNRDEKKPVNPVDFLEFEVLPRLDAEQIYYWSGHNFRTFGNTLKGTPPWRASQSGTSFHVWWDGEKWAWTDKAENSGGDAVNYRYRLKGGTGYPRGKDFIEIVKELAEDARLEMPPLEPDEPPIDPELGKQIPKEEFERLKTKQREDSTENHNQIKASEIDKRIQEETDAPISKIESPDFDPVDVDSVDSTENKPLIEVSENEQKTEDEGELPMVVKADEQEITVAENKTYREPQPNPNPQKDISLCQQVSNDLFGNETDNASKNKPSKQAGKEIKKAFCQQVYDDLFKDKNYIYVFHQFHEWKDTHYEPIAHEVITKKIHDYCDTYPVISEKRITYPYAAPSFVNMALSWLKQKFGIDSKLVNPPGLNCIDGILQLTYDPDSQSLIKTLVPHDPRFYYLYAPQATYHIPSILLPDSCNRLLSCLDAPQRDIFLKTIGAAFDLPIVRRYRGREVKALILQGNGSNGKDALREATSRMFGETGIVSVSLADFMQYDAGRKFPASKLVAAMVNWVSENSDLGILDKLQSLKAAITGEELSAERKGKDEYPFNPKCVHLFNANVPPKLQGGLQAIQDRFAFIKFNKTFKTNPRPGELQADPRFLYNPEFVRTEVLPWYLHYCLDALERLMKEGINYEVTQQAWEDLRADSDHIYAFCQEVGIGYKHGGQLGVEEVYKALREWYINNGSLQVTIFGDSTKDVWSGNPAWGDTLIKGKHQIFKRLLTIFPEARRERDSTGRSILVGIGWLSPTAPDGACVSGCYSSEDGLKQSEDGLKMLHPLQNQHSEATEAVLAVRGENQKIKIEETSGCGGRCPACFAESAKNLANAMLRCECGTEVQELLAQYDHLSEAAWRSLTEDGHDYVRNLLFKSEMKEPELETQDYKEESPPPNHLQQLQNADSVRGEASSDHLQTASDHLQKCSDTIQNPPREEEVNYAIEVTDAVDNANELKPLSQEYAIDFGDGQIAYSYIFIQRKGNICQFQGLEKETIELLVNEDGKFVENVAVKKME